MDDDEEEVLEEELLTDEGLLLESELLDTEELELTEEGLELLDERLLEELLTEEEPLLVRELLEREELSEPELETDELSLELLTSCAKRSGMLACTERSGTRNTLPMMAAAARYPFIEQGGKEVHFDDRSRKITGCHRVQRDANRTRRYCFQQNILKENGNDGA